jgi:hypothetical protein
MGTQLYQSGGDDHGAVVETNENQVPEVGMQEASGDPDRIAGDQDNDNETGAKAHVPLSDAEKRQLLSKLEPLLASPESLTPVWQWLNGDIEYLLIAYGRVYAQDQHARCLVPGKAQWVGAQRSGGLRVAYHVRFRGRRSGRAR